MNIGNSSLYEIANAIKGIGPKVTLYPHVNMDGDTLGSCIALAYALQAMGKNITIVLAEEIPENLAFLDSEMEFCMKAEDNKELCMNSDAAIIIDSGELNRLPGREEYFLSGTVKICVDHHGTAEPFCDYNYIDPDAAATGQIIWNLIKELGVQLSDIEKIKIAEAIFTAITTDTGNFQYSNTQKETHEIMVELYDWGLNASRVSVEIYQSNRVERLRITAEVLSKMELICNGKVAIAYCSQDMLLKTGGRMEETEWIVGELRGIRGVEVAVFLKEDKPNQIKASLRSKNYYNVAELAKEFGGGGHIRASGYTSHKSLYESIQEIKKRMQNEL